MQRALQILPRFCQPPLLSANHLSDRLALLFSSFEALSTRLLSAKLQIYSELHALSIAKHQTHRISIVLPGSATISRCEAIVGARRRCYCSFEACIHYRQNNLSSSKTQRNLSLNLFPPVQYDPHGAIAVKLLHQPWGKHRLSLATADLQMCEISWHQRSYSHRFSRRRASSQRESYITSKPGSIKILLTISEKSTKTSTVAPWQPVR